ncbi:MAG: flavin reductase family protein [bacterium]|nr:flavin reductase family protein [bacterium]
MEDFSIIQPEEITDSFFKIIGRDWMLITAGNKKSFNTMTAAWGGAGVLWHTKVCYIFVRPERYTYEFLERSEIFTLSFFDNSDKRVLNYCGTNSGRDVDKVEETGITPIETAEGAIAFEESRLIIECKKMYFQDLDSDNFLDPAIKDHYKTGGVHRMYVGEVVNCYTK